MSTVKTKSIVYLATEGGKQGAHVEERPELERISVDLCPVIPEHGLPRISELPNVAVEPARGDGSRKMA